MAIDSPPGSTRTHTVTPDATTLLGRVLGTRIEVPTYHHQGLNELGAGVRPTGWADDGTVEAIEISGRRFAVGVQWHPEEGTDRTIFRTLVQQCSLAEPAA